MENVQEVSQQLDTDPKQLGKITQASLRADIFKKLRGGLLLVLGYLLSPLCWWNDLFFNLPIAYFFGYVCSLISPKLLLPCSIIGYWLSNIVGILLIQFGSAEFFQKESPERSFKKELFTGLVSSTVFTLVILALVHLKVLDTPDLFSQG